MLTAVDNVVPPGGVMVTTAQPAAIPLGIRKLICPVEANTPYSSAGRVAPSLSVTLTAVPARLVVSGRVAGVLPFSPVTPKMLAISSAAKRADRSAAAFTSAGSGSDVLPEKLPSPEY